MKSIKKILAVLLAAAIAFTAIPAAGVKAAEEDIPTTVRMSPGERDIQLKLSDKKTITDVKTSSKKMIAKVTYRSYSDSSEGDYFENSYTVSVFSEEEGKYTLTVNYSDKTSDTITIYNYHDPIKAIYIDGEETWWLSNTDKKTCKVKVELEKGYSLKKLEYVTLKVVDNDNGYETREKLTSFKNGGEIKLNKQPYSYKSTYEYSYEDYYSKSEYSSEGLFAYTELRITYKDKYTKKNETYYTTIASVLVP